MGNRSLSLGVKSIFLGCNSLKLFNGLKLNLVSETSFNFSWSNELSFLFCWASLWLLSFASSFFKSLFNCFLVELSCSDSILVFKSSICCFVCSSFRLLTPFSLSTIAWFIWFNFDFIAASLPNISILLLAFTGISFISIN